MAESEYPEFTRMSSKGQIVIPQNIRNEKHIKTGSVFEVIAKDHLIVLKQAETGMTSQDIKLLKEIEEAWKDVEEGRIKKFTADSFLEHIKKWEHKNPR